MKDRAPKTNLVRAALHRGFPEGRRDAVDVVDWRRVRKSHPLNQLLPATTRWVASLPASSRPIEILKTYPRIANRIAFAWRDPKTAQDVLDELLIGHGGARQGFSAFARMELLRLRSLLDGAPA